MKESVPSSDNSPAVLSIQSVAVSRGDRWQVYRRLQELSIPCQCLPDGSFQAEIATPLAALQLWSVIQQVSTPRCRLAYHLDRCWEAA